MIVLVIFVFHVTLTIMQSYQENVESDDLPSKPYFNLRELAELMFDKCSNFYSQRDYNHQTNFMSMRRMKKVTQENYIECTNGETLVY